jgi:hypothetical protein
MVRVGMAVFKPKNKTLNPKIKLSAQSPREAIETGV